MHDIDVDFDLSIEEISKIEGAASLDIKVRNNKIEDLQFLISEWKRFYTQAIRGKPVTAIPQLVARICGTCSNAHLLASIKAIEQGYHIIPSAQTMLLRKLLYYGLIIRDHALHLYIFSLPDVFHKDSILDFDENIPEEHRMLDDAFSVKEVGNQQSIIIGGRSVHAPFPTIGGFLKLPAIEDIKNLKTGLLEIRPRIMHLIDVFAHTPFILTMNNPLTFTSLASRDFSFLEGNIQTTTGNIVDQKDFSSYLDAHIIPYSHARGFTFNGSLMMSGALARLNIIENSLHAKTRDSVAQYLSLFPSQNLFHNNLAQAIEILHAIDSSLEIIDSISVLTPEPVVKLTPHASVGVGIIDAPRGILSYRLVTNDQNIVTKGEIIVPTGINQIIIEKALYELCSRLLAKGISKEDLSEECENLIRAFDPCMSCASHFLKLKITTLK